jgi:hypothetical protein
LYVYSYFLTIIWFLSVSIIFTLRLQKSKQHLMVPGQIVAQLAGVIFKRILIKIITTGIHFETSTSMTNIDWLSSTLSRLTYCYC